MMMSLIDVKIPENIYDNDKICLIFGDRYHRSEVVITKDTARTLVHKLDKLVTLDERRTKKRLTHVFEDADKIHEIITRVRENLEILKE